MRTIPELPTDPIASAALELARSTESESVLNHSVRSYLWAVLLAEHENVTSDADYDPVLLFAATVMHDLGVGSRASGQQRFEIEGADLAAELLVAHAVSNNDVDRVWEAIAIHTSPGIAERRGLPPISLARESGSTSVARQTSCAISNKRSTHTIRDWRWCVPSSTPSSSMPLAAKPRHPATPSPANSCTNAANTA